MARYLGEESYAGFGNPFAGWAILWNSVPFGVRRRIDAALEWKLFQPLLQMHVESDWPCPSRHRDWLCPRGSSSPRQFARGCSIGNSSIFGTNVAYGGAAAEGVAVDLDR